MNAVLEHIADNFLDDTILSLVVRICVHNATVQENTEDNVEFHEICILY